MFLGIKSIIGRKDKVKKTNNLFMFSRMAGFNSSIDDFSELPAYLIKYTKRYQRDKLIKELKLNWGLKYYSLIWKPCEQPLPENWVRSNVPRHVLYK